MLVKTARPPMGWNSWDCYGTSVTEGEVIANAEFMAARLAAHGWDTVVVDIDWADPTARAHGYNAGAPLRVDGFGRLVPDPARFPSAAGDAGFGPLADRIHRLGLRFGIHTMRGIPRVAVDADLPIEGTTATAREVADHANVCEWNPDMVALRMDHPASQAYYDSTLRLYAHWGVDFIKADDMSWPYQSDDIAAYVQAIERCGRGIALSLSPGRDLSLARLPQLRANATMWRICDDLWDDWADVVANFPRFARWAPHAGPAGWPDGDMLPLGRIGIRAERGMPRDSQLTLDEQVSLLTLWIIARSPLMFGGDLPSSPPETIALLTRPDVLEVLGSHHNREVFREGGTVLWAADGAVGVHYAALFNLDDAARELVVDLGDLGFDAGDQPVAELWSGQNLLVAAATGERGVRPGARCVRVTVPGHGARLLRQHA